MKFDTFLSIVHAIGDGYQTKKSIQTHTNISWASCCDTINSLSEAGLITEDKSQENIEKKPGPKTVSYKFSDTKNLIMGMEITPFSLGCSVVNLGKKLMFHAEYPLDEELTNVNIYRIIRNIFYQVLKDSQVPEESVTTLVFSLTGALDREHLIWITSPKISSINSIDFNFFRKSLPAIEQIHIIHDVIARANSLMSNNGEASKYFAFMHVSDGVGLTVKNKGDFILGYRGLAGELGHIPVPAETDIIEYPCFCGKSGCIESYLSSKAIKNHIRKLYGTKIDSLDTAAEKIGKEAWKHIYSEIKRLSLSLCVTVVNLFDPEILYLGGEVIETICNSRMCMDSFTRELHNATWLKGPKKVIYYREGDTNTSYGAAINFTDSVVLNELYVHIK